MAFTFEKSRASRFLQSIAPIRKNKYNESQSNQSLAAPRDKSISHSPSRRRSLFQRVSRVFSQQQQAISVDQQSEDQLPRLRDAGKSDAKPRKAVESVARPVAPRSRRRSLVQRVSGFFSRRQAVLNIDQESEDEFKDGATCLRDAGIADAKFQKAVDSLACTLATQFRLERYETKRIVQACVPLLQTPQVTHQSLEQSLRKVFDVQEEIEEHVIGSAHTASVSAVTGAFDISRFMDWYMQNMFTHVVQRTARRTCVEREAYQREISETTGIPILRVEELMGEFNLADVDGSGEIDLDEFKTMLRGIMCKHRKDLELPAERTRVWYNDARGCNENLTFIDFCHFYEKYFPNGDISSSSSYNNAATLLASPKHPSSVPMKTEVELKTGSGRVRGEPVFLR